jgi:hypothetical protein
VKAAMVPHGCGKEQEGELAVEAPMADDVGLCVGQWAAFIACRLHGLRVEVRAHRYSAVWRRASVGALSRGSGDGPLGSTRRPYGAVRRCVRIPRMAGAKGTNGPDLEALGSEPTRTPRRARLPEHGARRSLTRQSARHTGGALERGRAVFQPVNTTLTVCFSKKMNRATKTVDTKVVDKTSLYNICKGRPMFFSTV